jgi:hypothetical protein
MLFSCDCLQVSFIKDLIQLFANAPVFFRNSAKKRCFYEPQRPPTNPEQASMSYPASPNQAHATVPGIAPALSTVSSVQHTASGHNASVVSGSSGHSQSVFSDSSAPPLTPAALITRLDINAVVDVLEVHHDAQVSIQYSKCLSCPIQIPLPTCMCVRAASVCAEDVCLKELTHDNCGLACVMFART